MNKKILIIYATYGSGHKTVANYLYESLKKEYNVKIMDILEYDNILGKISKNLFELNFKHKGSLIFSLLYNIFDHKITTLPYKPITKSMLKNKKLKEEIVNFNPDLIICTHFFGITMSSLYKDKKLINSKLISIITDYVSHELWEKDINNIDALIVSNKLVKDSLVKKGISKDKIYSYGIPLSCEFSNVLNKDLIKNKYKVNNDKKTILFFAGGSIGSDFSYSYFKKLVKNKFDANIIFVCGKNEKLKNKCNNFIELNNYKNVRVLGFSNEVNNLLNISDFVITKPGGISITECLEMKKPMILIPGNGGQEIYNALFVSLNGYGTIAKTPEKLIKTVDTYLNKTILKKMRKNLNNYQNNNSIKKIMNLVKKCLTNKNACNTIYNQGEKNPK